MHRRMGLQLGLGLSKPSSHVVSGGGGGGDYVASAVRFDARSYLIGGAKAGTTQVASFTMRVRAADLTNYAFFIHQAGGGVDLSTGFNFETFDIVLSAIGGAVRRGTPDNTMPLDTWVHLAGNMDLNHPQGSRLMSLYLDRVSVFDADNDHDGISGTADIDRSLDFVVPGHDATTADSPVAGGEGVPLDLCDYIIWLGTLIDWSDPANMNKISDPITGNPVDPAEAVAAFGTPQLLLSGDKDGFIVNQGDGSAVSLLLARFSVGNNGPGSVSVPGALVGKQVISVIEPTGPADYSDQFEATVSVSGQVQQIGEDDLSSVAMYFRIKGNVTDTDSPTI